MPHQCTMISIKISKIVKKRRKIMLVVLETAPLIIVGLISVLFWNIYNNSNKWRYEAPKLWSNSLRTLCITAGVVDLLSEFDGDVLQGACAVIVSYPSSDEYVLTLNFVIQKALKDFVKAFQSFEIRKQTNWTSSACNAGSQSLWNH